MEILGTLAITGIEFIKNRQTDKQTNKHSSLYIGMHQSQSHPVGLGPSPTGLSKAKLVHFHRYNDHQSLYTTVSI